MRVCVCVGEGGPLHILTHQGRPTGTPDIKATTEQVVTCMEPASPCTPPPQVCISRRFLNPTPT